MVLCPEPSIPTLRREGTSVRITLSRGGGEPFEVPMERCRFGPEDGAEVKREVDRLLSIYV